MGVEKFSGAFDRAPLHCNSWVPPGDSSSASPDGAPLFCFYTSASRGSTAGV